MGDNFKDMAIGMPEKPEVLPDSRAKTTKGAIPGPGGYWMPVFCANCGTPYGWVPEENCDFACWLCKECSETWGSIADTMFMPDEIFWERVKQAQIEKYGRMLTQDELTKLTQEEPDSPISKLVQGK
jgi:hypothetical protein